ncbi:Uncharacterized protein APZ42_014442, partial [Daphnia magna]
PENGAHTNQIEGLWTLAKKKSSKYKQKQKNVCWLFSNLYVAYQMERKRWL